MQQRMRCRANLDGTTLLARFALFTTCVLLGTPVVAGPIYKWTDENGKVHFEDRPPPGRQTEKITIKEVPPAATGSVIGRPERTTKILEALTAERRERNEARESERRNQEERKQNCIRAKRDLAAYEQSNRLYDYDENGARRYLDDGARLAASQRARAVVEKWCARQ